ncbi:hypothetical protein GH714_000969 [Hevea brasiliensis]|uniref:Uncharacterized protein n=1 Tax=Hevea brasiliensis TaxID=3981 RepID=A0A6A6LZ77_HEVBR|nr:hypothetical protein GH714_000969 [Hevea brasiliensis]
MGFVDGSLPRPEGNSPDEAAWIKGNSMAISWLFNSLHFSLHDSMAFFDTVMELWKDLEERFSQGNAPHVHQLEMEIVNTQQRDQSVVTYYTKLKGLWDEYGSYSNPPNCTCGAIKEFATENEKEKLVFMVWWHKKNDSSNLRPAKEHGRVNVERVITPVTGVKDASVTTGELGFKIGMLQN